MSITGINIKSSYPVYSSRACSSQTKAMLSLAQTANRPGITVSFKGKTTAKLSRLKLDTVEDYKKLTNNKKNELRKIFNEFWQEEISFPRIPRLKYTPVLCPHPLYQKTNMKKLVKLASDLHNKYPQGRLVGIGRSPLWILETAKYMYNRDYINVACSGMPVYKHINPDNLKAYKKYLTKIKLDPQSIVNNAKKGQKTVLVDYLCQGTTFIFFLDMLTNWSNEIDKNKQGLSKELEHSVIVHTLQGKPYKKFSYGAVKCKKQDLITGALENYFTNHPFGDTLGIKFEPDSWQKLDPLHCSISPEAKLTKFWIMDNLNQKGLLYGDLLGSLTKLRLKILNKIKL